MLTPEEAAAVVRRAAELDTPSLAEHDGLDESVVRAAALEVGLSERAVEQAVGEWRAGVLVPLPALPADRRAGLPRWVAVETRMDLPVEVVDQRLQDWLRGQWFERLRTRGAESEWSPRSGLVASARRAVDVDRRLRLSGVGRVRMCVAPAAAGTRVRLVADLGDMGAGLLVALVAAPAVVFAAVVPVGLAVVGPDALLALPAGAAVSGLGWLGARSALDRRRIVVLTELERALDHLSREPTPLPLSERAANWALQRLPRQTR